MSIFDSKQSDANIQDQINWWMNGDSLLIDKLNSEITLRYRYKQAPFTKLHPISSPKPGYDTTMGILELNGNRLPPIDYLRQKNTNQYFSLSDYLIKKQMRLQKRVLLNEFY